MLRIFARAIRIQRLIFYSHFSKSHFVSLARYNLSSCKQFHRFAIRMAENTVENDKEIHRISGPNFEGIFTEPFKELISIFERYGYEVRIAGGAVRDLLSGLKPHDIDLATTATPQEMREIFTKENIRMFNEQGEKHGTVCVRIQDKENFEITTLRIDKVTDGRHAEVEFTRDWFIDAERRDLTINSMFLCLDGKLVDFFHGRDDLKKRRVAFVGSPTKRIQEDYLRILRYFRFYGRIADENSFHEEETIKAISENVEGMKGISGERIWSEWKKILSGNLGGPLTLKMIEVGLAPYIGLCQRPNTSRMEKIWKQIQVRGLTLHPITLLTTLFDSETEMQDAHARLKLSAFERDLGLFVVSHRGKLDQLKTCQNTLVDTKVKIKDCKFWIEEVLKVDDRLDILKEFSNWDPPTFPVSGKDLKDAGCPPGQLFSVILQKMKDKWKDSEFQLDKAALMKDLSTILDEIDTTQLSPKRAKVVKQKPHKQPS